MTNEMIESNRLIIQSDKSSPEALKLAIENMWEHKLKNRVDDEEKINIETAPMDIQLLLKYKWCEFYFGTYRLEYDSKKEFHDYDLFRIRKYR